MSAEPFPQDIHAFMCRIAIQPTPKKAGDVLDSTFVDESTLIFDAGKEASAAYMILDGGGWASRALCPQPQQCPALSEQNAK
eukprot:5913689-Amphidinium_carterae.1